MGQIKRPAPFIETLPDRATAPDPEGVSRFVQNRVVSALLEAARIGRKYDLNDIWLDHGVKGSFTEVEMREFYQLIGSSVDFYEEVMSQCFEHGEQEEE